eukprot:TRINITY_DN6425_c0_g1_i3.p1 TRINITY_DN6425_c0_g1~~TRINITY_DN6425_c0_g1_i3.p1  ORF type:complete len:347 (-),score=91.87 TRINITY_DN6425_c0_g1_i3:285-1325(-)
MDGFKDFGKRIGKFFKKSEKNNIADTYELLEKLGSGTFATVRMARDRKTGKLWAIKIIDKKAAKADLEMMEREVDIMQRVHHTNIIYMHEIYDTDTKLYLVLELVTGGELFDRIVKRGSYTEKDASDVIRKIVSALAYLHKEGIVHRDLKPENLLYSDETDQAEIKLADFGLSRIMNGESLLKTACGTPGYVAPEVLKGQGYGASVDMWSVGVILYILLCGFPPFYDDNVQVLFQHIMAGNFTYPEPWWDDITESAKDLINHLLVVDPAQRYSAAQALEHPWLKGETTSVTQLQSTLDSMKTFNARRKFKMAVLAAVATNKVKAAMGKLGEASAAAAAAAAHPESK